MKRRLVWLAAAAMVTVFFGTMYVCGQQILRQSANDTPAQLAEDAAARLDGGEEPVNAVSPIHVDMRRSLAPWVIIYDKQGRELSGSAYLDGKVPTIPVGVLKHATPGKPHAITWQPTAGVRAATVSVAAKNYYVVGGRSLRLIENHEQNLTLVVTAGWLASLVVLTAVYAIRSLKTTH